MVGRVKVKHPDFDEEFRKSGFTKGLGQKVDELIFSRDTF